MTEFQNEYRLPADAIIVRTTAGRTLFEEDARVRAVFGDDLAFAQVRQEGGWRVITWHTREQELLDSSSDAARTLCARLEQKIVLARTLRDELLERESSGATQLDAEDLQRLGGVLGLPAGHGKAQARPDPQQLRHSREVLSMTADAVAAALVTPRIVDGGAGPRLVGWGIRRAAAPEMAGPPPPLELRYLGVQGGLSGPRLAFEWNDDPAYSDGFRLWCQAPKAGDWRQVATLDQGATECSIVLGRDTHRALFRLESSGVRGSATSAVVEVLEPWRDPRAVPWYAHLALPRWRRLLPWAALFGVVLVIWFWPESEERYEVIAPDVMIVLGGETAPDWPSAMQLTTANSSNTNATRQPISAKDQPPLNTSHKPVPPVKTEHCLLKPVPLQGERPAWFRDFERVTKRAEREGVTFLDDDLRIELYWSTVDDLDLHVTPPGRQKIYHNNRRVDDGRLLFDENHPHPVTDEPIEVVLWPRSTAPGGEWVVLVREHLNRDRKDTLFWLVVRSADRVFATPRQTLSSETWETTFAIDFR